MTNPTYEMTIDLTSFRHLGEGLYSGVPAVITEIVANAWDADATEVNIDLDPDHGTVTITDNGHGMTQAEVNQRFLAIGYRRRSAQGAKTPMGRSPMGRKGIGKLSLFAIANVFEVRTTRENQVPAALEISRYELLKQITQAGGRYYPKELPALWKSKHAPKHGTEIHITDLKSHSIAGGHYIRERLARRFSILGPTHNFRVLVDGVEISVADRGYMKHLQFAWPLEAASEDLLKKYSAASVQTALTSMGLSGWIGTVREPKELKESTGSGTQSSNGIVIMVRGRVAQENMLDAIGEARLFAQYLIGEIHADHLDEGIADDDDPITSARQMLRIDDPRVIELREAIRLLLNQIALQWGLLREKRSLEDARKVPAINEWLDSLKGDRKAAASKILSKIGGLKLDDESERVDLYKYSILAFEKMDAQSALSKFDSIQPDDIKGFVTAFDNVDEVEAALYHDLVKGRLAIIREFEEKLEADSLEVELQKKLFEHLWLFDPAWDRVTGQQTMETTVSKFLKGPKLLTKEIEASRMDIVYRQPSGEHVVIELKKGKVRVEFYKILEQVQKYQAGLKAHLQSLYQVKSPTISVYVLLGREPTSWHDEETRTKEQRILEQLDIRVLTYSNLIKRSRAIYEHFLKVDEKRHRLSMILNAIGAQLAPTVAQATASSAVIALPPVPPPATDGN